MTSCGRTAMCRSRCYGGNIWAWTTISVCWIDSAMTRCQRNRLGLAPFLFCDPALDLGMQDIQRQGAAADHLIVKCAQVELVAQLLASFLAQAQNFQLSQLVRQSLSGPRDVAVHFGLDIGLVHRSV